MKPGKSSRKRLYFDTRYRTPEACGYCNNEYKLIPLAQYLREKGISRDKAKTLLKRGNLLGKYISKIAPRGQYFVMENPEKPITKDVLSRRQYGKGRNRNKSENRGAFRSEIEYLEKKLIGHEPEDKNIYETPDWFDMDYEELDEFLGD